MQIVDRKNIEKRLLFYWSKVYSSSIKSSENYEKLERTIAILISDYNLYKLKEIPEYLTKWNIREEKYSHLVLTDALEIFIIELDKFKESSKKKTNSTLDSWLQFINNPGVRLDMENNAIKKAKKVLKEISEDEHERRLSELRQKYIMDQHAIEDRAYDKGLAAGLEQGIEQGILKTQIEIVKKMQTTGFTIKQISEITGLSEEQINKILEEK